MNNPDDTIAEIAFAELIISCQMDYCNAIFQPTLDEPATDPVEEWAQRMANHACRAGWSLDTDGRVKCPKHRFPV